MTPCQALLAFKLLECMLLIVVAACSCVDTNNGAADTYGDACAEYTACDYSGDCNDWSWCGGYDDTDFTSNDMCCVCGGGTAGDDDSAGWTWIEDAEFKYFPGDLLSSEAEAVCVSHGGHLATINSASQNTAVFMLADGQIVWIGLTDAASEGTWVWMDGSPVVYSLWHAGQPDNYGSDEDCAVFWYGFEWNDVPCDMYGTAGYVCSRQDVPSSAPTISSAPTWACDMARVLAPDWVNASTSNLIGTLSSTHTDYELSFQMHITGGVIINGRSSILHVGGAGGTRLPKFEFQAGSFNVRVTQSYEYCQFCCCHYSTTVDAGMVSGGTYNMTVRVVQNSMSVYVDGQLKGTANGPDTYNAQDVSVYVGDPWLTPANVRVRAIRYTFSSDAACPTPVPSPSPTTTPIPSVSPEPSPAPTHAPTTSAPTPAPTRGGLARDLEHELCFTTCELNDQYGEMDATLMNGATCVQGEGVVFDGVDDYVDLADVELGGEMTIAIWAKFESLSNWGALFDFDDGLDSNSITVSHAEDTGALFSGFQTRNGDWYAGTGSQISVGEWKFFVITIGDGELREYSDGVQGGEVSYGALPAVMTRTYHYLGRHTSGSYLNGAIRSLRIWRHALGADEVAELTTLELLSDSTCFGMPTFPPTPLPSSAPTPIPSPSPTPVPTPSPTPTNEFTVVPDSLYLSTLKPDTVKGTLYLVNLNEEVLHGSVWLNRSMLSAAASWSVTPHNFTAVTGIPTQIDVTCGSSGLMSQDYAAWIVVEAKAWNNLLVTKRLPIKMSVFAQADPTTTLVTIEGSPTLDLPWSSVFIFPHDSDGFSIATDQGEDFEVSLKSTSRLSSNLTAVCTTAWFSTMKGYRSECTIPDISIAGNWKLVAALDGVTFFSTVVRASCPKGRFEDSDHICQLCPQGSTCASAGSTLEALELLPGHWRLSPFAMRVRQCALEERACRGGANTTRYCMVGYDGVLCAACAPGYFFYSSRCQTCDREHGDMLWRVVAVIAALVLFVWIVRRPRFIALCEYVWSTLRTQIKILWATFQARCQQHVTTRSPLKYSLCRRVHVLVNQIIAQFGSLLYATLPDGLQAFIEYLDFTNLNPLSMLVGRLHAPPPSKQYWNQMNVIMRRYATGPVVREPFSQQVLG